MLSVEYGCWGMTMTSTDRAGHLPSHAIGVVKGREMHGQVDELDEQEG